MTTSRRGSTARRTASTAGWPRSSTRPRPASAALQRGEPSWATYVQDHTAPVAANTAMKGSNGFMLRRKKLR